MQIMRLPPSWAGKYLLAMRSNGCRPGGTGEKVMAGNTFETSIEGIQSVWGPLSTELVAACSAHLEDLLRASPAEAWLGALHRQAPATRELYRDPTHGFVLLAHTEGAGLYRPPHDHGRAWVIYAVQQGEIEMGTYGRLEQEDGSVRLVKRGSTRVRPGQVQVYLPGDIHDTRCMNGPALLFRFTERDLKKEDTEAHRVTKYVERDGAWTVRMP
jgi:hypothetical protein